MFVAARNSSIRRGAASGPIRKPHPSSGYAPTPCRLIESTTAFMIWTTAESPDGETSAPAGDFGSIESAFEPARTVAGRLREDVQHLPEARREAVDFLGRVVHVERRPRGRGDVQALHEGLRAVVAGADRDPLDVGDGRYVVRVAVPEGDLVQAPRPLLRVEPWSG